MNGRDFPAHPLLSIRAAMIGQAAPGLSATVVRACFGTRIAHTGVSATALGPFIAEGRVGEPSSATLIEDARRKRSPIDAAFPRHHDLFSMQLE